MASEKILLRSYSSNPTFWKFLRCGSDNWVIFFVWTRTDPILLDLGNIIISNRRSTLKILFNYDSIVSRKVKVIIISERSGYPRHKCKTKSEQNGFGFVSFIQHSERSGYRIMDLLLNVGAERIPDYGFVVKCRSGADIGL